MPTIIMSRLYSQRVVSYMHVIFITKHPLPEHMQSMITYN